MIKSIDCYYKLPPPYVYLVRKNIWLVLVACEATKFYFWLMKGYCKIWYKVHWRRKKVKSKKFAPIGLRLMVISLFKLTLKRL
jgi:hypothetical protein